MFYVFNDYGVLQFTTSDEDYASTWCDANEGYYSADEAEYEEPADIDSDFGFDPYEGCYTYDC